MEHISQDSALRRLAAQSALWDGTPLNIARVARRFGVSRPTATSRVRELEARGLVLLVGDRQGSADRPPGRRRGGADRFPRNKDWLPLAMARRRGVIERGFILYRGTRAFIVSRATDALPLAAFLMGAGEWLRRQPGAQALNEVRRRTNQRGVDFTRRAV